MGHLKACMALFACVLALVADWAAATRRARSSTNAPATGSTAAIPSQQQQQQQQQPAWKSIFQSQMKDHMDQLERISVDGISVGQALNTQLQPYQFLLGPQLLQRSMAHAGPSHRLRTLMHRLRTGQQKQLRLRVLGGSISWGAAVERGQDWFSRLHGYMAAAFPGVNVTGVNGCVPATPSSFSEVCFEKFIAGESDLVFVEFTTNDGYDASDIKRKSYERLVRKVGEYIMACTEGGD